MVSNIGRTLEMSKLIDSPFEICSVCDQYVFLDQTQEQCAREHKCGNINCPLKRYFTGKEVPDPESKDTEKNAGEKR